MKNELISVIVPVYNVEKYIRECLDSILAQTYNNIEVILVDDGSTDSSAMICDEYAESDSRIRVVHQNNKGLSGARNTGLDLAKGEYIIFVDSDDKVTDDYIENKYLVITESGVDFVFSDIESTKLAVSESIPGKKYIMSKADVENWLSDLNSREYVLMVVAWNKLYKATLLEGIRFEINRLHEDEFFINKVLHDMNSAAFIPDRSYIYRDNDRGITGSENSSNVKHLDVIDAYSERIKYAIDDNEDWFAKKTLSNALYKAYQYYKSDQVIAEAAYDKLVGIYKRFKPLLTFKQRLKYSILLFLR